MYEYCGFLEEDVWGLQVLRLIGFRVRGLYSEVCVCWCQRLCVSKVCVSVVSL